MTVLDTDVLVAAMRGDERCIAFIDALLTGPAPVAVSAVTVMQLFDGIGRSRAARKEEDRVRRALLGVVTYAFTHEIGERAGSLMAALSARGRPIGTSDLMIAATALHHREPVATRNRREFERVPGLEVLAP